MKASTTKEGRESHTRSLLKAVSWRCVGTADTFLVSFLVLTFTGATGGDTSHAAQMSGSIAAVDSPSMARCCSNTQAASSCSRCRRACSACASRRFSHIN